MAHESDTFVLQEQCHKALGLQAVPGPYSTTLRHVCDHRSAPKLAATQAGLWASLAKQKHLRR